MAQSTVRNSSSIRYEADEHPPLPLVAGLGVQLAVLCIAGIMLTPAIVVRAGGGSEEFLSWAVFAAVLVSGVTTIFQAVRVGRIGSGYVLLMGTSGSFIAVSIAAIAQGGPALLCLLVVVSSIFQFALATHLSLFRRIFTPAVSGTVIMLIAVTVMPIVFDMLKDVPEGTSSSDAAWAALITLVAVLALALKGRGALRLWAPVIGVAIGSIASVFFGFYDTQRIADAAWFGIPTLAWPGFDLSFDATFWILLPSFVLVTLVGAVETIGDSIAIQRVSWRDERAVDYRSVQGAVNADGLGNLLSGLVGTVPNTTYSTSVSVTELTGVASRRVGIAIGILFLLVALFPKLIAVVLAIPGPVVAAYVTVLLAMLFVMGMRIAVSDGIDYRKGLVIGASFWLGVGFQNGVIFPEYFAEFAGGLLQNGMTAGGLSAMLLNGAMNLFESKRTRTTLPYEISALEELQGFIARFVAANKWDSTMAARLEGAAEETLLTMLGEDGDEGNERANRSLALVAYKEDNSVVLEFQSTGSDENLQDQVALLRELKYTESVEEEVSLRLLKKYASSVRHQQYHNTELITLRFDESSVRATGI